MWLGKEHCKATWQPEASIPESIIREYECGIQLDTTVQSVSLGGQTNHTLHVCDDAGAPPKEKKQKLAEDRYVFYFRIMEAFYCIQTQKYMYMYVLHLDHPYLILAYTMKIMQTAL